MVTNQELVEACVKAPDDKVLRLIYADWLEEHDRADEAKLLRKLVELGINNYSLVSTGYGHYWEDQAYHGSPLYYCKYCDAAQFTVRDVADKACPATVRFLQEATESVECKERREWEALKRQKAREAYLVNKYGAID